MFHNAPDGRDGRLHKVSTDPTLVRAAEASGRLVG